jgi:hypothetical protein
VKRSVPQPSNSHAQALRSLPSVNELGGRLLLDPRTLTDDEARPAAAAVIAALA